MDEARLSTARGFVPDVGAACLEVGEVAARRNLEPLPHSRRVNLEIIGMSAREPGIAGREPDHTIRQLQKLEYVFRVIRKELVLLHRRLGSHVSNDLHLVEFVNSEQASRVLAGGSRFPSEARRVRRKSLRQLGLRDDLVTIKIRERDFGG